MPELRRMDETGRSKWLTSRALEYARSHPARVLKLALLKIARTWSPAPLSEQFGRPLYRAILLMYAAPLDLLVILGIVRRRLPIAVVVYLLLPAVYLTGVHAMTVGSLRYRLPAVPALAVLAASALARQKKEHPHPSLSRNTGRG